MMNTPSDFQTPAAPGMVNADQRPVDVVVLFSGGLDSILAAKVLEEQGLRVCCLHCHSPFFGDPGAVERWSNLYGLDIRTLDVSDDFCAMLRARPAHGFGKVMNPCVDCKILLLRHARLYMESIGARLLATGEVMGQRPMSQRRDVLNAIRRDALLENVSLDENGKIDFADKSVTENTRVSYPINHIQNIVRPISSAPAAKNVIFLSADAFGVLPPVSILTPEQTQYYFLSGFTAKLAGTERGITEPTPTFSACFGQAFLELHPTKYAEELVKKMQKSGAKAYLVNTGWNGTGKRISIKDTRGIIDAILSGDILKAPTKKIPYFDFEVPTELPGVDSKILDPRDTYADASEWENKAKDLASRFEKNFVKYTGNDAGKALVEAGPHA